MSQLKVSIIIPMKNEEENIGLCLDSIRHNSLPGDMYEIICIDNGSTDKTVEIARKSADKVFEIPGKTISGNRNFGARVAEGKYIAFLDADCVVDKDWLKHALVYIDNPEYVCFGSVPEIPDDASWVSKTWAVHSRQKEEILKVRWLPSPNIFIKSDVFQEVGGFNEALETCEDVDFCYRVLEKHEIVSDKKIKVTHRGEVRTLWEFFKKELWRGKSNIKGIKAHGFKLAETPSILIPCYYFLIPFLTIFLIVLVGFFEGIIAFFFLSLVPAFLISLLVLRRSGKYAFLFKTTTIYLVYFTARAIALVR